MKPVTDLVGNELLEGDLVACKVGSEVLLGRVVKVSAGGIAVVGGGRETPPFIAISFQPYTIICNPDPRTGQSNTAIRTLYKMFDPASKSLLDALSEADDIKP